MPMMDLSLIQLDVEQVRVARKEEVGCMEKRNIWTARPATESWEMIVKPPVRVRWVETLKSDGVRSRSVARDFKGGDEDRDGLFAATPPLESKRLLISRAAMKVNGKLVRKLLFTDAKKAHPNPECKEDVFMVSVAPLKDTIMVTSPYCGKQRRSGRLEVTPWWSLQSGGAWLVLWLADGTTAVVHNVVSAIKGDPMPAPCCDGRQGLSRFEWSVAMVVVKMPTQHRCALVVAHARL